MKILIGLTRSDTTAAGAFTHISQIGAAFRARGSDVVFVLGGSGVAVEKLTNDGFKVIALAGLDREIRPIADCVILVQLIWIILKERPSVCSWHTAKIGALGRIVSWLTGRRSFYVAHGVPFFQTPYNKGYKLFERLERWLAYLPSQIICVCKFDCSEYVRIGVNPRKLKTIPNGMRGRAIEDIPRSRQAQSIRFVTAARFETQKDFATLGAACTELVRQGLKFELHIFGNGPQEEYVRKCFDHLPSGLVFLRGVVDDFAAQLVQFDVFVLCSRWEGLPRAIIEAMACGLPVIASNVGGVSELVEGGINGYLVPVGDASQFSSAMLSYFEDPSRLQEHGRAGLKKYQAEYTLDTMLQRYCAEYLTQAN